MPKESNFALTIYSAITARNELFFKAAEKGPLFIIMLCCMLEISSYIHYAKGNNLKSTQTRVFEIKQTREIVLMDGRNVE